MSATALHPNLSPAYQPRNYRGSPAPYSTSPNLGASGSGSSSAHGRDSSRHVPTPLSLSSSSHHASGSGSGSGSAQRSSTPRMEHPLPSRPASPAPTSFVPRIGSSSNVNASTGIGVGVGVGASPLSPGLPGPLTPGLGPHASGNGAGAGAGKGSSLRNEVKHSAPASPRSDNGSLRGMGRIKKKVRKDEVPVVSQEPEEGEVREVTKVMRKAAAEVLKLLASLPAPLPELLPPTFLPTPAPTPPAQTGSFLAYAREHRSSSASSSSSPPARAHPLSNSLGKRRRSSSPVGIGLGLGLGLGLEDGGAGSGSTAKKGRPSSVLAGSTSMMPSASAPGGPPGGSKTRSPELLRTASMSHVHTFARSVTPSGERRVERRASAAGRDGSISPTEGKETWSKARWSEAAAGYKARAVLLKRHGDARLGTQSAKPQFAHLGRDTLLGLLCMTDAVLLWLHAYWCDEQAEGRVKGSPYRDSQALRDFVRAEWEKWVRRCKEGVTGENGDDGREMGRGMVGLMYLIEAIIHHHLSAETITALSRRSNQLHTAATPVQNSSAQISGAASSGGAAPGSHANGAAHINGTSGANGTGPSPSSTSDASPSSHSAPGPSPHSSTASAPELPADIMSMIAQTTTQTSRAAQHLLNARHHLPLSILRARFPSTYDAAIHSELADEALPAPNDPLGAARKVDIDVPEHFVWPIELGMCAPLAHLSVFGRMMVREFAMRVGRDWDTHLGA